MTEATYDELMRFAVDFANYYDEYGIQDKFDKQTNKMQTSPGVYDLVQRARKISPLKLKGKESSDKMRALTEDARDKAIKSSPDVIDLRAEFSKKIAASGGTRALIAELVDAYNTSDTGKFADKLREMETFTKAERGEEFNG